MGHHILSPSGLSRILNCWGSLYGPPVVEETSDAAEEGTTCHALLEFCLSTGDSPRNHLGSDIFNPKFPISIEMVEAVELFIETVDALCVEFSIDRSAVMSERHLVHPAIPNQMFGGTSDCLILGSNVLVVMDLKFGRRPVFADSPQLSAYSLLAASLFQQQFEKIVQIIVQPRANPSVSRHEPGMQELSDLWGRISQVAGFILDNPDMLTPMPDFLAAGEWCKFCKRREGCPERMKLIDGFVDVSTLTVPTETGLNVIPGGVATVPTEDLVRYKKLFDVIKEFMKDVDVALANRAGLGQEIPGYKLVARWGNRKWVEEDEETMRKKLPRALKGLTSDDVTEKSCKSPAQVEKVLKEKGLWKELKDKFEKLYSSPITGVKLVASSDKGEAIRPETAQEFLADMKKDLPDE